MQNKSFCSIQTELLCEAQSLLNCPLLSLTCQTVYVVFGDTQPCARQFGDALDSLDSLTRHNYNTFAKMEMKQGG
jgi:hypothetical protein